MPRSEFDAMLVSDAILLADALDERAKTRREAEQARFQQVAEFAVELVVAHAKATVSRG